MMGRSKREYAPSAIEQAGQRAWNEASGFHQAAARRNFLLAACGMAVGCVGVGFAAWRSAQPQAVPWLIERGGPLQQTAKLLASNPDASRIDGHMRTWVEGFRTVMTDAAFQKKLIDQTYAWTDSASIAHDQLDAWYKTHNPNSRVLTETVEVDIQSVIPQGGSVWQIDWKESEYAREPGRLPVESYWRAIAAIKIVTPKTDAEMVANWDGVFVTEFHVTQTGGTPRS